MKKKLVFEKFTICDMVLEVELFFIDYYEKWKYLEDLKVILKIKWNEILLQQLRESWYKRNLLTKAKL